MILVDPKDRSGIHYINERALMFSENDLEDPQRIAVSLVSGTVIIVNKKDDGDGIAIPRAANGDYEKWTLKGYSTKIPDGRNAAHFIFARLSRSDRTALIVFSLNNYNIDGSISTFTTNEDGSVTESRSEASSDYYYVRIGYLSETDGSSDRVLTYDCGQLSVGYEIDEIRGSWSELFIPHYDNPANPKELTWIEAKSHMGVNGGVTMFVDNGSLDLPSLYDGLLIDMETLEWVETADGGKVLRVKDGAGGSIGGISVTGEGNAVTGVSLSADKKTISFAKELTFIDKKYLEANYYNKTDVDSVFFKKEEASELFVTLDEKEQEIIGVKTFLNGLKIGSSRIWQSQDDVVYIDANLVVRGGVTMYAQNNVDIPSFMESLLLDENTLKLDENGYLTVIGGAGESIEHALTWSGFSTGSYDGKSAQNIYIPSKVSELTNDSLFATQSWVNGKGYATQSWVNDKLDDYVTELGLATDSSGTFNQYLTYTKGGVVNKISVGYAGNATQLKAWSTTDLSSSGVWNTILGMRCATFSPSSSNIPTTPGTWANGLITFMPVLNYGFQLAYLNQLSTGYDSVVHLFVRNYVNGSYKGWYRLVTDGPQMTFDTYASGYMRLRYSTQNWYYLRAYSDGLWIGLSNTVGARVDAGGNLLTTGGITMYSDQRKKTILRHVELSLKEVADAPLIEHYYNSDDKKTTHVGSIAQYWAGLNDWFCKKDDNGYYTMEIQNAALASAISIARELSRYESKTDKEIRLLKDEVKRLKKEIKILKSA